MKIVFVSLALIAVCACSKSEQSPASPLATAVPIPENQNWPEWRGPTGQGIAEARQVPTAWNETRGIVWKTATPGRGWSSAVIWGRQLWITTAIEKPASKEETERRLAANTGDQPVTVLDSVSLRAVCLDRDTGKIQHDIEVLNVREPQWVHQLNSYASPSPVIEAGRLYGHFGTFGTGCVDTSSGKVLWTNTEIQIMHENGPGSSPVLWNDFVIFHCDGSDRQFIAALDKRTGTLAWKTDRSGAMRDNPQMKKAYGTPLIIDMNGQPALVSPAADWVYGYDPASGKELWKISYGQLGFSMSVRPVAGDGMFFFSTCFSKPEVFAVKYEGVKAPEVVWHDSKSGPNMASPVFHDGMLFYVSEGGIVSCVDAKTGQPHYRERIRGKFSAAPILADGKLYFCSREGMTFVLAAEKQFKVLAENKLDGSILASPAALDGAVFVRTDKALYRLGQ